ncbi:hypothetical protein KPL70_024539 [Citrus sinensis]|nr:hypothetical protein KPL70_024539 [Citrus sinensis]
MGAAPRSFYFCVLLCVSFIFSALAQNVNQFIYHGFNEDPQLQRDGLASVHSNGLLQLTNTVNSQQKGHAFYRFPIKFNTSSSESLSFCSNFVFAIVPELLSFSGQGMAFVISPSKDLRKAEASPSEYLGLFNASNNGQSTNHILAIELDTVQNFDFDDIDDNHVGIDVNSLISLESAPAAYFSDREGMNKTLELISGDPIQIWISYDGAENLLNVPLAPMSIPKPTKPLLSKAINLSHILLETMYVGFSASTAVYIVRNKRYEEVYEDWEKEYGPQRFTYKNLYKATKGFKDKDVIGKGGFGKVYRGVLVSNVEIAVKKVSHDSKQGMKEFVAELVSMGRLRHRNLVKLRGYCRRKGEFLLVYDYMPNGSLDKILHTNIKPSLSWYQRFRIIRGVASGLLYLHEDWEQVVLHRDIKPANVLLDADLNGKLGDFGLARLYDHDTIPQTTKLVGTFGYMAPELMRTGKASTSTDVYAFGVFMLEVASGRRPIEQQGSMEMVNLVDWVSDCWKKGAILDASDSRLEGIYEEEQMELVLKLGLFCSHPKPEARPNMRQVMQYLDGNATLPDIPRDSTLIAPFSASNDAFSGNSSATMSTIDSILTVGR